MNCERNICYQQEYNGGCDTCPCNRTADESSEVEITTQEAMETLKFLLSIERHHKEPLRMAIEALEKQATTQATSEWIPVSERQPEDPDESVLITVNGTYKNIAFKDAVILATYDKDEGWIIDGYQYWLTAQVTAWQPLPEPYKGESV